MKEKVKRILDLVRAGKLTLDDAAPLLAALSAKLALTDSDRELMSALLAREDLDTGQVAEHLLLLRGIKDPVSFGFAAPPLPPRPPGFAGTWSWESRKGRKSDGLDDLGNLGDLGERIAAKVEQAAAAFAARAERLGEDVENRMSQFAEDVERGVESAVQGSGPRKYEYRYPSGSKVLRIEVNSEDGDSYEANLPVSLAPHLHKLIPPYGAKALEKAGFTLEALQLIIEADPPAGPIIEASDEDGNSVTIGIKGR